MSDKDVKTELMQLLGIKNEEDVDKVLAYTKELKNGKYQTASTSEANKSIEEKYAVDFANAKELNEILSKLVNIAYNSSKHSDSDIEEADKHYILLSDELRNIYKGNPKLSAIEVTAIWQQHDFIKNQEHSINEYYNFSGYEAEQEHIGRVNRLCVLSGSKKPKYTSTIKKIVTKAKKLIQKENDDKDNGTRQADGYIPEYVISRKGRTLYLNNVLYIKTPQNVGAPIALVEQMFENEGKLFKPDFGKNYTRSISSVIADVGFEKELKKIFFSTISSSEGIIFRNNVSRQVVDEEKINTKKLDAELRKKGAEIRKFESEIRDDTPIDLSDIPF